MERFSDVCTLVGFLNLNKKEKKRNSDIVFVEEQQRHHENDLIVTPAVAARSCS